MVSSEIGTKLFVLMKLLNAVALIINCILCKMQEQKLGSLNYYITWA